MKRVVVESPYKGGFFTRLRNIGYARAALRDCIKRGEAPIASHLLLTQPGVLKDYVANERKTGIAAGHAWIPVAEAVVFYVDYGMSSGMYEASKVAWANNIPVEYRRLLGK